MPEKERTEETRTGRWSEAYPWLGTGPVPTEPCVSEEIYRREIDSVFRKVWLCVARVEELPEAGSYKLRRLEFANTSAPLTNGR